MQELRFVLIIVGALAIAALLFHGLWTSKKENKAKFADKPLGKLDDDYHESSDSEDIDVSVSESSSDEPQVAASHSITGTQDDPLFEGYNDELDFAQEPQHMASPVELSPLQEPKTIEPSFSLSADDDEVDIPSVSTFEQPEEVDMVEADMVIEPTSAPQDKTSLSQVAKQAPTSATVVQPEPVVKESKPEPVTEPEMQVLVINVHCSGEVPFEGHKLFDSMHQNGLLYGEMDIYHRHADLSGTGKVLFSVANMMQPGTFKHSDPNEFSTKGISFFMTLPCYGDPDQNFKLMLRTAQQIADDMSGHVLDDQRNLITPTRIDGYRKQIQSFKAAQEAYLASQRA